MFSGFFVPLLCFAFFNFIEIIVFSFAKFPEYKINENTQFMIPVIFACLLASLMANTAYIAEFLVKNYLASQYKPTMEKLIKQKNAYK